MKFKPLLLEILQEAPYQQNRFVVNREDPKKQAQLHAMSSRDNSFAGWMKNNGKIVSATGGNFQKIKDILDKARQHHELQISDKYYHDLLDRMTKARNDTERLSKLYNAYLAGSGLGSKN